MIIGSGIDICEIERIKNVYKRRRDRFIHKIYREGEIDYCFLHNDPFPHLAGIFAAKEAAKKAFGERVEGISFKDIEIIHTPSGKPGIFLSGVAKEVSERIGITYLHVSISHERHYAVAFLIFEK